MFEWSEEQLAIRDAVRRFVAEEVAPNVEELEHGETPPYAVIRKLYRTFGLDEAARAVLQARARAQDVRGRGGRGAVRREDRGRIQRGPHHDPDHRAVPLLPRDRDRARVEHGPGRRHHHEERHPGPDGALGSRPDDAGQGRRVGHHRAGLGIRRARGHEVDRGARRRRVRAQREQDLHHERPLRGHDRVLRQARRRQRDAAPPATRCSPSSSTRACPGSSSPSPSARWACTRRRRASSS